MLAPEPSGDRKEFAAGNGIPKMPFPNIPGDKETQSFFHSQET